MLLQVDVLLYSVDIEKVQLNCNSNWWAARTGSAKANHKHWGGCEDARNAEAGGDVRQMLQLTMSETAEDIDTGRTVE